MSYFAQRRASGRHLQLSRELPPLPIKSGVVCETMSLVRQTSHPLDLPPTCRMDAVPLGCTSPAIHACPNMAVPPCLLSVFSIGP